MARVRTISFTMMRCIFLENSLLLLFFPAHMHHEDHVACLMHFLQKQKTGYLLFNTWLRSSSVHESCSTTEVTIFFFNHSCLSLTSAHRKCKSKDNFLVHTPRSCCKQMRHPSIWLGTCAIRYAEYPSCPKRHFSG